ncbi:M14 family metallopeptidase [Lacinutrix chionoecetis]
MINTELKNIFETHKETTLFGRYINNESIKPLLKKHASKFKIEVIGQSVLGADIHSVKIGSGEKRILMWSQMHGNESTTTKAVFDLLNFLSENPKAEFLLKNCVICIIPILNPDGAKAYTRLNANKIDLNRDAQALTQPESKVLANVFKAFKPHYSFNLHGQRTIFSAGNTNKPATLSFLSPAQDEGCTITENRKIAMSVIVKMNNMLQNEIPKQVGVYDDAFNINCVGDTFQSLNVPTVLFEAGHYANDYDREEVRRLIFQSYIVALNTIANNAVDKEDYKAYLLIPENKKMFYDIIIKNALVENEIVDVAIQYQEQLVNNKIHFVPKIEKIEKLFNFYAHNYLEANNNEVFGEDNGILKVGYENLFVVIKNVKFSLNIS